MVVVVVVVLVVVVVVVLTCVHSALELSGRCALQIYLLTYLLTYLLSSSSSSSSSNSSDVTNTRSSSLCDEPKYRPVETFPDRRCLHCRPCPVGRL